MLQLHRYFKESHSQYLPFGCTFLDLSQFFYSWGESGMWEMCKESPEIPRAAEPRGEGLAPGTSCWIFFWESISAGCFLGLLAGRCCWGSQQRGCGVHRAWGRGCLSSRGSHLPQGKPQVLGRGPDPARQRPPEGSPPTASSGGW